jgi:hypothetical protein
MDDDTLEIEMARQFYGYGCWKAPYWFIGPEQGKGPKEADDNVERAQAWARLSKPDLVDCKVFHDEIGESSWHREPPLGPALQRTWRPLMLLLKTILDQPSGNDDLRTYQRDRWGRVSNAETCVIELCGLAARGFASPIDRESFRRERVKLIRQKLLNHSPATVVMYGQSAQKHWEEIAGCPLEQEQPRRLGPTLFVFTTHPNTRGRQNSDWERLGKQIREFGVSQLPSTVTLAAESL